MEPITIFLLWLASVIYMKQSEDIIVLVEDPNGKVGQVVVSNSGGAQILNIANTSVSLAGRATAPEPPKAISAEEISALFQSALDAAPPEPESFLLYFLTGTSELTDESRAKLQEIEASFSNRVLARATIIGHTDTVGNAQANYDLALQRANTIVQLLVDAGMEEGAIDARSHGETDPITPTLDNVDEPSNRRVEVSIW